MRINIGMHILTLMCVCAYAYIGTFVLILPYTYLCVTHGLRDSWRGKLFSGPFKQGVCPAEGAHSAASLQLRKTVLS